MECKNNAIEKLKNSLINCLWFKNEIEKVETRLKILHDESLRGEEDYSEIEAEERILDELLSRVNFEFRQVKNIKID